VHALFSFVDGRVEMLDRFVPMATELALGGLQVMLGGAHRLQTFSDVRMRWHRRRSSRDRRCCHHRNRRRLWTSRRRWEGDD